MCVQEEIFTCTTSAYFVQADAVFWNYMSAFRFVPKERILYIVFSTAVILPPTVVGYCWPLVHQHSEYSGNDDGNSAIFLSV